MVKRNFMWVECELEVVIKIESVGSLEGNGKEPRNGVM